MGTLKVAGNPVGLSQIGEQTPKNLKTAFNVCVLVTSVISFIVLGWPGISMITVAKVTLIGKGLDMLFLGLKQIVGIAPDESKPYSAPKEIEQQNQ